MNEIQILYGEIKYEPPKYWVEEEIIKRRFWFNKIQYWAHSEFMKLGPYDSFDEAQAVAIRLESYN